MTLLGKHPDLARCGLLWLALAGGQGCGRAARSAPPTGMGAAGRMVTQRAEATTQDWAYPGAKGVASGVSDQMLASRVYVTPRPFEDVWRYYAQKVGYQSDVKKAAPPASVAPGGKNREVSVQNSFREDGKSSSFNISGDDGTVVIFIRRSKADKATRITITSIPKQGAPTR
jgi:hypothetical protein